VQFQKGTVLYEMSVIDGKAETTMPLTVLRDNGKVERPAVGSADATDAYVAEINEVIKCVRTGKPSAILGGELARDAVVMCHKQTQSVETGRVVKL
ncbi:MAG: hypothetical protein WD176_07235, partial [Pirellulales bacterium]